MNLKGRSFLTLLDFTPEEIGGLLDLAAELKAKKKAGVPHADFIGKNIALIFEKTSTRTRCSFEVAGHDLGMGVTYLDPTGSQIGKKESIADTARVLGRMYDGIEYRGFGQQIVETLAKYAGVPVWNGLTNEFHPTQILADLLTIQERFGRIGAIVRPLGKLIGERHDLSLCAAQIHAPEVDENRIQPCIKGGTARKHGDALNRPHKGPVHEIARGIFIQAQAKCNIIQPVAIFSNQSLRTRFWVCLDFLLDLHLKCVYAQLGAVRDGQAGTRDLNRFLPEIWLTATMSLALLRRIA